MEIDIRKGQKNRKEKDRKVQTAMQPNRTQKEKLPETRYDVETAATSHPMDEKAPGRDDHDHDYK